MLLSFKWRCFPDEEVTASSALTSLLILRGCLEAGLESLLKAAGGNLLILRISHCPNILTDRSLWLASCYCRALQAVTYRWVTPSGPWSCLLVGTEAAKMGHQRFGFFPGVPQTPWAMR